MSTETLCPYLNWVICPLIVEVRECFIYFGRLPDTQFADIFPFRGLSFHFCGDVHRRTKVLSNDLTFSSVACAFPVVSANPLSNPRS